jgi:hypothetical protein
MNHFINFCRWKQSSNQNQNQHQKVIIKIVHICIKPNSAATKIALESYPRESNKRGSEGEWLGGYAKKIVIGSAYLAELWGMYERLLLVRRMGFRVVEISVDSTLRS